VLERLEYFYRLVRMRPRRYRHLLRAVYGTRAGTIVEIGVFDGKHARQMIETAAIFRPRQEIEYFGFDLFELLSETELVKEHSKRPPPCEVVRSGLVSTGARIKLYMGYTRDTLPEFVAKIGRSKRIDFVFIDGGHAVDTIRFDWGCVLEVMSDTTVVIFDDYYENSELQVEGIGCRSIVDGLDRDEFDVEMLSPRDSFPKEWGTQHTRMVLVTKRRTDGPPS